MRFFPKGLDPFKIQALERIESWTKKEICLEIFRVIYHL
jgi:hypothetical protein